MAEDITPKLIENIVAEFHKLYNSSGMVQALLKKVQQGTATYAEAQAYSLEVSRLIGRAYEAHVSSAILPDGKMYYNIASRLIPSTLDENYKLVSDYAVKVQQALNTNAGIGLKALVAEQNQSRVDGLINMVSNADQYDDVSGELLSAVENYSQNIVDETIKTNVGFHYKAGMSPKIIRKAEHKCCKWCSNLTGEYDYPDVPHDVYRRHKNCRCTVLYDPADGSKNLQNVHTKQWTDAENRGKIEKRKTVGVGNKENPAVRAMANGPRRGALTAVSEDEEQLLRKDADDLGIPQNVLRFNNGVCTSFDDSTGLINIRGDIFPSEYAENPDSILSARCALAHEYYGHLKQHPSRFDIGDWRDEFQASYRAALDTPNLTEQERVMLMLDAFERAQNANVPVELNTVARKMIYGIE